MPSNAEIITQLVELGVIALAALSYLVRLVRR
jgi:hypothetical protein